MDVPCDVCGRVEPPYRRCVAWLVEQHHPEPPPIDFREDIMNVCRWCEQKIDLVQLGKRSAGVHGPLVR